MYYLTAMHFICFCGTVYREIYESNVGNVAYCMKGVEIICVMFYLGTTI